MTYCETCKIYRQKSVTNNVWYGWFASMVLISNLAYAQPKLLSISPTAGSTSGGTLVTFTLSLSINSYTPVRVYFGGVQGTVVSASGFNVTAVTPAHAAGGTPAVVLASNGFNFSTNGGTLPTFTYGGAVAKSGQTITFGSLSNRNLDSPPFTISATASSGLPVAFYIASGPATISGNTITLTGPGIVVVRANQAGSATYNAAPTAERSFTVIAPLSATVDIAGNVLTAGALATPFTPVTGAGGATPYSYVISPSLPSGLSLNATTGVISGTPVVVLPTANYIITVTDSSSSTATGAFKLTVNATVTTTVTVSNLTATYNTALTAIAPVTAANGTGALIYAVTPPLPAGLSLNTSTGAISGTPAAAATVATYTVSATDTLGSTSSKSFSLTVNKASQTITFPTIASNTFGVAPFAISATASSGLPVSLVVVSGPATHSSSTLTITAAGTVVLRATQAGNGTYAVAPVVEQSVVIQKAAPVLTWSPPTSLSAGTALDGALLNATAMPPGGTFSYWPAAGTVLTAGTQTLSVTDTPAAADVGNYAVATATRSVTVTNVSGGPQITAQPSSQSVSSGGTLRLTVGVTGTAPFTYAWKKSGAALPSDSRITGAATATLTITNFQQSDAGSYTVEVSNSLGSPALSSSASITLAPAGLAATHALVTSGGYSPGGTVTITNTITYPGDVSSLRWSVLLPTGWSFNSAANVGTPTTQPTDGDIMVLDWIWASPPPSPATFTYTLNVPATTTSVGELVALAEFSVGETPYQILATPDPLVVPRLSYHSADTSQNWKIDPTELTRVIVLYNTRFTTVDGKVRTGAYKLAPAGTTTADGFAANPDLDPAAIAPVFARHHTADYNKNGRIDPAELSRLIVLYNTRYTTVDGKVRTGYYKPTPEGTTTVDGFTTDSTRAP